MKRANELRPGNARLLTDLRDAAVEASADGEEVRQIELALVRVGGMRPTETYSIMLEQTPQMWTRLEPVDAWNSIYSAGEVLELPESVLPLTASAELRKKRKTLGLTTRTAFMYDTADKAPEPFTPSRAVSQMSLVKHVTDYLSRLESVG